MTEENLMEMRKKVDRAETIKRQITELKKINEKGNDVKIWGVCLYYDEECEERLYADFPIEDLQKFFNEFVTSRIIALEKEFLEL